MNTRQNIRAFLCTMAAALMGLAVPTAAQEISSPEPTEDVADVEQAETQNEGMQSTARTADTGIGEVGRRQTEQDSPAMRDPLGRIDSRINNRIENRIRNRIDRNYDPTANAASPFKVAEEQSRTAGRTTRRTEPR